MKFYFVINQPITEYSTIQECLQSAEDTAKEVGQEGVSTDMAEPWKVQKTHNHARGIPPGVCIHENAGQENE